MNRWGLALLLLAWLALGVGGKILRYSPEAEGTEHRSERLVRTFLEDRGWTFAGRKPLTAAGLYSVQSFTKPGCPHPLRIAVLGAASDVFDVVASSLGADVAFFNDGEFSPRPSKTAYVTRAARAGFNLASNRVLLPLVVAPAPKPDDPSPCAPPPPGEWSQIGAE